MPKPRLILLSLCLLPLLGCDFDYLVVEVESRDVCIRELVGEVPAGADGSVSATLGKEDAGEGIGQEVDRELELPDGWVIARVSLQGMTVAATQGVADLAFLEALRLNLRTLDPAADLPAVELVEFVHGANRNYNTSAGATLYIPGNAEVDLNEYFETSSVELSLELEGALPEVDWKVEVEPCFNVVAEYRREL